MTRLRRWILPLSTLSLALSAVAYLAVVELEDERPAPAAVSASAAPAPAASARGTQRAIAPPPAADRGPGAAQPARPGRREEEVQAEIDRVAVLLPKGAAERRPNPVKETPQALRASSLVVALARASSLVERIRVLDEHVARLSPAARADQLAGLLDTPLPGGYYEAETLRLAAIARLGELDDLNAESALIARLDSEVPRPQRLLALEFLAVRPHAAIGEIQAIARDDHDPVVQGKARWVLSQRR
ncbi:MAG: hypothetical protein AB7G23_19415 [Vicinamibacterales bacterium]